MADSNLSSFAKHSLEAFYKLCEVPRCSFHTQDMFKYLCEVLTQKGYIVKTDSAKNIYAKKGAPKLCLQGHYDMVCVGESAKGCGVKPMLKNGYLKALDSSLGADNGIALACMLSLEADNIELLFTNDEEVGMIGANNLSLSIESSLLLNLDSEDIHEIVLGCAGGVDIECDIALNSSLVPIAKILSTHPYIYKVQSQGAKNGFMGGHSGIDIHKNKHNVISAFGTFLHHTNAYIITLNAGEKRNAIPSSLESIVLCDKALDSIYNVAHIAQNDKAFFDIMPLNKNDISHFTNAYHKDIIAPLLNALHSGVLATSPDLNEGVLSSLNLSLITQTNSTLSLIMMARANSIALLEQSIQRVESIVALFNKAHKQCATMATKGFYAPWERSIEHNHKTLELLTSIYKKHNITPHLTQIHAGLECGILKRQILAHSDKKDLLILSIGPSILEPHSCNERLVMADFAIFCNILSDFIDNFTN